MRWKFWKKRPPTIKERIVAWEESIAKLFSDSGVILEELYSSDLSRMSTWQREQWQAKTKSIADMHKKAHFAVTNLLDFYQTLRNWTIDPPVNPADKPPPSDLTAEECELIANDLVELERVELGLRLLREKDGKTEAG